MKAAKLFIPIVVWSLAILSSCSKSPIDLEPQQTIECPEIGIGSSHVKNNEYQTIIDNYVSKGYPSLSAVIYTPEEGLWAGTSGLSDISSKTAANTCNVYYSGSVAKMYTVVAAMSLYEDGKLDLDAKIENYLSEAIKKNLPNAKKATIRQLMNHTSGIPDHDYDDDLNNYLERSDAVLPAPEAILEYLFDDQANFEPGTKAEYSSANTVTLALVIDSVTAGKHEDVITEKIINKLGLSNTYYRNEYRNSTPENLVSAYYGKASENKNISKEAQNYCTSSYGDAGVMATAHDYYIFIKGLMEGNIVSQNTLNEMLNDVLVVSDSNFSLDFGLGLFNFKLNEERIKTGHGGFTVGGMSYLWYYPTKDAYLVLLSNTSDEDDNSFILDPIVGEIENLMEIL